MEASEPGGHTDPTDLNEIANDVPKTSRPKLVSAWQLYKKLTELPSNMEEHATTGKILYALMTLAAFYMLVVITIDESVYTNERELTSKLHILPDVFLCPFVRTDTEKTADLQNRKFTVWYLKKSLRQLDMQNIHLDALAHFIRDKKEPDDAVLSVLMKNVRKVYNLTNLARNQSKSGIVKLSTVDLHALWSFIALPSVFETNRHKSFVCTSRMANTEEHWCRMALEAVWVGSTYCALFPFQMLKTPMQASFWNIGFGWGWFNTSYGYGIKSWLGNLQLQSLSEDTMWHVYKSVSGEKCFSSVHYNAYETVDLKHSIQTLCHDNIIFKRESPYANCTIGETNRYWMFKVGLVKEDRDIGYSSACMFPQIDLYPRKVSRTKIQPVLSTVQRIQLYGGVLGFTTGLSFIQLLELLSQVLSRRVRKLLIRFGKLVILMFMTFASCWFAIDNLRNLTSNNRYTTIRSYQSLKTQPFTPHLVISSNGNTQMMFLNHSRLSKYNVSVDLLQFITALSGTSVLENHAIIENFLASRSSSSLLSMLNTAMRIRELSPKRVYYPRYTSKIVPEQMFMSTTIIQFQQLVKKLDFDESIPPVNVYEQFRLDLCLLIRLCVHNQRHFTDCCRYARYETFEDAQLSDAITIRFPKEFTIDQSGNNHGIEIFFDTDVIREANLQYIGPNQIDFVRDIQLTRSSSNAKISDLSFMVFDGGDVEQTTYGKATLDLRTMGTAGQTQGYGFSLERTLLLQENEQNNCRVSNQNCNVLKNNLKQESSFLARSLAEKTMCGCHICHSTAPNPTISRLWTENGCCSASEASRCYLKPVTCCQIDDPFFKRCCFDASDDLTDVCTNSSVMMRTLLSNSVTGIGFEHGIAKWQKYKPCSLNYEVGGKHAAVRGSVVAEKLAQNDRVLFDAHMKECKKERCKKDVIKLLNTEFAPNTDESTVMWSCIRIYASVVTILTTSEYDLFSVTRAAIEFVSGFGLLFGLCMITLFELLVVCSDWVRTRITPIIVEDAAVLHTTSCTHVLFNRVLRSVKMFTDPQNENTGKSKKTQTAVGDDSATEKISETQAAFYLVVGCLLAVYASYLLVTMWNSDNTIATNIVSFNGTLTIPSVAMCVNSVKRNEMLTLLDEAVCEFGQSPSMSCSTHFTLLISTEKTTCAVVNNTNRTRSYNADKRRFVDFQIHLAVNRSESLENVNLWFGHLSSIENGVFAPAQKWDLSIQIEAEYELTQTIYTTDCHQHSHQFLNCPTCDSSSYFNKLEKNRIRSCCTQGVQDLRSPSAAKPRCHQDKVSTRIQSKKTRSHRMKLIDLYGVVDVFTIGEKHGWSVIVSNIGTVIDGFLGVNALNMICAACLALIFVIKKTTETIGDIFTYYIL